MDFLDRLESYSEEHCWQYDMRLKNLATDLIEANMTQEDANNLTVSDFTYMHIKDKKQHGVLKRFIQRHEWLGTISMYPTHWFAAYYKSNLAGVLIFNVPNAFSTLLGDDTPQLERLISRGACISWSPKNLASNFLMWAIKYLVSNTTFRLFTAYSDPTAKELGTIYQACNFYYIGLAGSVKRYINPWTGKMVSDRFFRQTATYKRYAQQLKIDWQKDWSNKGRINWKAIPDDIELILRDYSKKQQREAKEFIFPSKHKYAYVLGKDKRETKALRKLFLSRNKIYSYPKNRGIDYQDIKITL